VLEAVYAPIKDDSVWTQQFVDASASLFGHEASTIAVTGVSLTPDLSSAKVILAGGTIPGQQSFGDDDVLFTALGVEGVQSIYYPSRMVTTMSSIRHELPPNVDAFVQGFLQRVGLKDLVGLVVHPEPHISVVVSVGLTHIGALSRHRQKLLSQLGLHFETAIRLRRRPEIVRAVVRPDGKVLHRESGAPDSARIASHVTSIERARTRRERQSPDAIDLWHGLVSGEASLVERTEVGSRRHYLVVDNPPARHHVRALSPSELDVVSYAARGLSAKLIGYGLGLTPSTVSKRLARAAGKIGVATRTELVRLAAMFTRDPRSGFDDVVLTAAEREVLDLLQRGLSNADIASLRNRSVRTIANQVAKLLRKTTSPSRRALAAR